jgi:hypothetical protein
VIPQTFMLTHPSQLGSVPPGPGYSSLLATLSRVPTYAEPMTAPTDLAGGAYASAPPPSMAPQTVTPPAPGFTTSGPTAVPALAALPAVAENVTITREATTPAAFTPPATWAPPVVPTAPVPASVAAPAASGYTAPGYTAPPAYQTPAAYQQPAYTAPKAALPYAPTSSLQAPSRSGMTYPPVEFVEASTAVAIAAPFAAVKDERPIDLAAVASDTVSYQPFGMTPVINRGPVGPPRVVYTASVWLVALMPLIGGGVALSLALWATEFYSRFTQIGLGAAIVILTFVFAISDSKQLRDASHRYTATPAWLLLSPVAYLIARAVRTIKAADRGIAPVLVFLVSSVLLAVAIMLVPEWVPQLLLNPVD